MAGVFWGGLCLVTGSVPVLSGEMRQEALSWFSSAEAQYQEALQLLSGEGVAKDSARAVELLRESAESGYAPAQFVLGGRYGNGRGVNRDMKEAVKWYRVAAEQGYAEAQWVLGACYLEGLGVKADRQQAKKLWQLAAEQGHDSAKRDLKKNFR